MEKQQLWQAHTQTNPHIPSPQAYSDHCDSPKSLEQGPFMSPVPCPLNEDITSTPSYKLKNTLQFQMESSGGCGMSMCVKLVQYVFVLRNK